MKNYDEMSDFEINKEVSILLGLEQAPVCPNGNGFSGMIVYPHSNEINFDPCNNPSDAWPIIVENEMSIWAVSETDHEIGMSYSTGDWKAYCVSSIDGESNVADDGFEATDQNPLRAAMICFLKMKDTES